MQQLRQKPKHKGGKPYVVCVRLTAAEVGELDRVRGSVSRSAYLRVLLRTARGA